MATETKTKKWTEEDKYWAIGGGAVVLAGGIYWYLKNKKANETDVSGTTTNYIDASETTAIGSGSSSSGQSSSTGQTSTTPAVSTQRQPDAMRYAVGQEVMAIGALGTKAYETKKMANGQYTSAGVLKATFSKGDKIGKIIWVGALSDGTFRYVVERSGLLVNQIYWIADYRVIAPIGKLIAATKTATSSLRTTLVLKKGSKGLEVRELQKRLGVAIDGDFGTKTLTALQKQKGVSQITLASFATTNSSTLNFNKILKSGVKGLEVVELQKRLGFTGDDADGDFGPKTESALFAMKQVKQTTLNQFSYV